MKSCPCGSRKTYRECCEPFHRGRLPDNALQLMRSRYAAYVLNLPDYIMQTTHSSNPHYSHDHRAWAEQISSFSLHSQFKKLEILDFTEEGNSATVTFVVHLIQDNQPVIFKEKSTFEKIENKWLYRSGQLFSCQE